MISLFLIKPTRRSTFITRGVLCFSFSWSPFIKRLISNKVNATIFKFIEGDPQQHIATIHYRFDNIDNNIKYLYHKKSKNIRISII